MGNAVLILGESGSGKTRSIRFMNPNTTGVFMVEKPRLPFREQFKVVKNTTYAQIMTCLKEPTMLSLRLR